MRRLFVVALVLSVYSGSTGHVSAQSRLACEAGKLVQVAPDASAATGVDCSEQNAPRIVLTDNGLSFCPRTTSTNVGLAVSDVDPSTAQLEVLYFTATGRDGIQNPGPEPVDTRPVPFSETAGGVPATSLSWTSRNGYFSDHARMVLRAPRKGSELVKALRSEGLLTDSENLSNVDQRRRFEEAIVTHNYAGRLGPLALLPQHVALRTQLAAALGPGSAPGRFVALRDKVRAFVNAAGTAIDPTMPGAMASGCAAQYPAATYPLERAVCDFLKAHDVAAGAVMARSTDLPDLQVKAAALLAIEARLMARADLSAVSPTDWDDYQGRVCAVVEEVIPVASYDVVRGDFRDRRDDAEPVERVFEFDYYRGYLGRDGDIEALRENEDFFIRVHGVPTTSAGVVVKVDGEVVSRTRAERGEDLGIASSDSSGSDGGDGQVAQLRPTQQPSGPRSSLILRVGRAHAGFYVLAVCAAAGAECKQVTGRHRLEVHGSRRWGIRSGLGFSVTFDPGGRQIIRRDEASGYLVTGTDGRDFALTIPFAVMLYLPQRELLRSTVEAGFGLGLDVLAPTRRWFAGIHLGFGPVGVMLAAVLERREVSSAPIGAVIPGDSIPDIDESYPRRQIFRCALGVFLTFDFDVFKRLYGAIRTGGLPGLGGGSK